MPARSKAQLRAMFAAASGKGESDIPPDVAREFIEATPKTAYTMLPARRKAKIALKRTRRPD